MKTEGTKPRPGAIEAQVNSLEITTIALGENIATMVVTLTQPDETSITDSDTSYALNILSQAQSATTLLRNIWGSYKSKQPITPAAVLTIADNIAHISATIENKSTLRNFPTLYDPENVQPEIPLPSKQILHHEQSNVRNFPQQNVQEEVPQTSQAELFYADSFISLQVQAGIIKKDVDQLKLMKSKTDPKANSILKQAENSIHLLASILEQYATREPMAPDYIIEIANDIALISKTLAPKEGKLLFFPGAQETMKPSE